MSGPVDLWHRGEVQERAAESSAARRRHELAMVELLARAEHPACILDADGVVVSANDAWLARVREGAPSFSEVGDHHPRDDDGFDGAGEVRVALGELLAEGSPSIALTCRCDHRSTEGWVRVHLSLLDLDRRPHVLVQHWDVTTTVQEQRREAVAISCARAVCSGADVEGTVSDETIRAILAATEWSIAVEARMQGSSIELRRLAPDPPSVARRVDLASARLVTRALEQGGVSWHPLRQLDDELLAGPAMIGRRMRGACTAVVRGRDGEHRVLLFFSDRAAAPDDALLALLGRWLGATERVGASPGVPVSREIAELVARASASDATVLLLGESGAGKTRLAEQIHRLSSRAAKPLLDLNCAGLAPALVESELFGHERGAFTGAHQRKRGLLELAEGGTVLLDEIGELDAIVQAKLLKVLESRTFRRVGGETELRADVRFIAATNRDLRAEVRAGRFREDLYYRLAVVEIEVPALRERAREIPTLAAELLATLRPEGGVTLSEGARRLLVAHDWPGNVRELRNVLERALLIAEGPVVDVAHLREAMPRLGAGPTATRAPEPLSEHTNRHVLEVLESTGWNVRRAAAQLGIARSTLYEWIRRNDIDVNARRIGATRGRKR